MARARTTKGLAKRIALDYFKKRHPFRSLKTRLSWTAAVIAALLAIAAGIGFAGRAAVPGPVSQPHAQFEPECWRCHGGTRSAAFFARTSDAACRACHDGAVHHEEQTITPACVECHAEHRGRALRAVENAACTRCHGALATRAGSSPPFDRRITGFSEGHHPEFAPVRAGARDAARIKFNHKAHLGLEPKFLASHGLEPLVCASCHALDTTGRLMQPIAYETHCAVCHPLAFDYGGHFLALAPGPIAPHDTPIVVRLFLTRLFTSAIEKRPSVITEPDAPLPPLPPGGERRLPAGETLPAPRTAAAWVERQVAIAERVLYRKDCALCHELREPGTAAEPPDTLEITSRSPGAGQPIGASAHPGGFTMETARPAEMNGARASEPPDNPPAIGTRLTGDTTLPTEFELVPRHRPLPAVVPPRISPTWLPHARFDHRSHRLLDCDSCHSRVRESALTADVLLPGIDTCRTCHAPGRSRDDCALCHTYHDRSRERPPTEPMKLARARTLP